MKSNRETTHKDFTVALDIGTTKVCAIVGRKNEMGQYEILGHGKVAGDGVQRGVVTNIDKTVRAIEEAISRAERTTETSISNVSVGIAGQHISSRQNHGMITRDEAFTEITPSDIDDLFKSMHKLALPPGDKILHILAQDYCVDDEWGITEPVGMCGGRLGANFHIITCQESAKKNIQRCVRRAGLTVDDVTLEPIASSHSVLTEDDKMDGVILIDIGGGTTDITIFTDGIINFTSVLPFGGDVITSDIRQVFRISPDDAELLKQKHGSALASETNMHQFISIANRRGQAHIEISELDLAEVIEARLREIFEYVSFQIENSNTLDRIQGGIVLTGGGSLLMNIDKFTEDFTGIPTRIGLPVEHLAQGYPPELNSPIYSTAIGLLIEGTKNKERQRQEAELSRSVAPAAEPMAQPFAQPADEQVSPQMPVDNVGVQHNSTIIEHAEPVQTSASQQPKSSSRQSWLERTSSKVMDTMRVLFDPEPDDVDLDD